MKSNVYFGGVPTEVDIKKLREGFPVSGLKVGQIIPYSEVMDILNVDKESHRFKTITTRWRKMIERETGTIIIGVEPTIGFKVLSEAEKTDLASQKLQSSARLSRRSLTVCARTITSKLEDEDKARIDHIQNVAGKMLSAAQIRRVPILPDIEAATA